MAEHIIDFDDYLRRREEERASEGTFALWGGEGEKSRFALPLWRIAYLCGAARCGLVREEVGEGGVELRAVVVLDLAADPARTDFSPAVVEGVRGSTEPPAMDAGPGSSVTVFLGVRDGRRWYVVATDREDPESEIGPRGRDDVYFLAGECAGLVFHRQLDREEDPESC